MFHHPFIIQPKTTERLIKLKKKHLNFSQPSIIEPVEYLINSNFFKLRTVSKKLHRTPCLNIAWELHVILNSIITFTFAMHINQTLSCNIGRSYAINESSDFIIIHFLLKLVL